MKRQNDGPLPSLPSPSHLFLTVLGLVFLAGAAVMLVLLPVLLPRAGRFTAALADALMMTLLLAPFLWWVVIRPLRRTAVAERTRAATVLACAGEGVITINEQGLVESFNPAAQRLFGYGAEEVVGRPLTLLMPERYREAHQKGLERVRSTGESRLIGKTLEMQGLRKDGGEFPLELSLGTWSMGSETFHAGIVRDLTERKRAEEALRETTETLQALVRASPLAITALDPDGNVQMWNPAAERIFGWSEQEVLGRPLPIVPPERQDEFRRLRQRVLQGEALADVEVRRQRRDGSAVDISISTAPLRDAAGAIIGIVAVVADITERRRAEERLRLQGAALAAAANAVVITDREGRITWTNPAFTRLTGYAPEEVIGRTLRLLKSGKQDQSFYQKLWDTILSGQVWRSEIINRRKDGSLYTEEQIITPVRDARGEITHFIAIHHDITERKRAEEARARLTAILEATSDFVGVADAQGGALYLNPAGRRMLGIGEDEDVSGHPIADGHPEGAARRVLGEGIPAAVRNGVWRGETALLHRDGRELPVSQVILAHKAPDGTVEFVSTVARDITEDKRFEAQLEATVEDRTRALQIANAQLGEAMRRTEEANRHKSEFLANMSHELRTPLNSIIGFAEFLRQQTVGSLNAKQARYIGHIHQSGQHLLQLINDILDLSKVEAGKFILEPEPLDIAATMEEILVIARGLAHQKAQTLQAEIEAALPPLRADPVRFKQICFNLLNNAVKFAPEQGRIALAARRAPEAADLLEIRVTDTGIGIKAEDLPRLFQEFVQLEAAAAKRHEGTGLGLALTKRLVELHGGWIWAESAGEGRGSTFTFTLPFAGPKPGAQRPA